jgi:hypothetical protein
MLARSFGSETLFTSIGMRTEAVVRRQMSGFMNEGSVTTATVSVTGSSGEERRETYQ